jgi:HK97 family phage prohead protease
MSYVIVDLDGTLILDGDRPNQPLIDHLNQQVMDGEAQIIIVSARPIDRLEESRAWLQEHGVAGVDEVHLNDFEGAGEGPNVGLEFKRYKYERLIEQYGVDEIAYVVDNDADVRDMARSLSLLAFTPDEALTVTADDESDDREMRAVYETPEYVRAAARKGLEWQRDGLAGEGLQSQTIAEAREMAAGRIDSDKLVRLAAWIRRHRGDWEGVPQNSDESAENFPGPGAVAGFLWGVDTTAADGADRVLEWADRLIASEADDESNDRSISEMSKNYETRALPMDGFTVSDDDGQKVFTGYAALFNKPSAGLPFTEIIKPGAFKRSISRVAQGQKVISFLFGHDEMRALATTASGRLTLTEDEVGLKVEARLDPADPDAQKVLSMLKWEPQSAGMSFAFYANKDNWDGDTREILEANTTEVSILSVGQSPAYPATLGLAAVRKISEDRLGIDAETLITTLESVKAGQELTDAEVEVIDTVRARLAPKRSGIDPTIAAAQVLIARLRDDAI